MAQSQLTGQAPSISWEKPVGAAAAQKRGLRLPFILGGVVILAAVAFLIASGTAAGARFFITVDEVVNNPAYAGQTVRVSGAVLGESIQYDARNLTIDFTIANVPSQYDDLATALHDAVGDPNAAHMRVHVDNSVKPELLQNEAQAILTGKLGADGIFYATELNLKCPSRFIEAGPQQDQVAPAAENGAAQPASDGMGA